MTVAPSSKKWGLFLLHWIWADLWLALSNIMKQEWHCFILSMGLNRPYTLHSQNPALSPWQVRLACCWMSECTDDSRILQLSGLRPQTGKRAQARSEGLTLMSWSVQLAIDSQAMINGFLTLLSFGGSLVCYVAIDHYVSYWRKPSILLLNSETKFLKWCRPTALSLPGISSVGSLISQ